MNKVEAALQIVNAVRDTVRESGPDGVPGGVLYAALMSKGCSLQAFENIMSILVASGQVRKSGQLYFSTK